MAVGVLQDNLVLSTELIMSISHRKEIRISSWWLIHISIYTLGDLGVLSNLIGSQSLANEHYSPPTE